MIRRAARRTVSPDRLARRSARLSTGTLVTVAALGLMVLGSMLMLNSAKMDSKRAPESAPTASTPAPDVMIPPEEQLVGAAPAAAPDDEPSVPRVSRFAEEDSAPPAAEESPVAGEEEMFPMSAAPPEESAEVGAMEEEGAEFVTVPVFLGTNRARNTPPTLRGGVLRFFAETFGIIMLLSAVVAVIFAALVKGREWAWATIGISVCVLSILSVGQSMADKLRYDPTRTGMFGAEAGNMSYAECPVTIPIKEHQPGALESPFEFWVIRANEDPAQHIILKHPESIAQDAFFQRVRHKVDGSAKKEAFVFIHGYNVDFSEGVRRAAQLAYDLKFQGAALCFSWPSLGTELGYPWDITHADLSVPHLQNFLRDIAGTSGADRIYVIAHSMGNRILTQAVETDPAIFTNESTPYRHLVLAAPDVDRLNFLTRIAPHLAKCRQTVTLYCSSHDKALQASKKFNGMQRAGDSIPSVTTYGGLFSVDCSTISSGVLGHNYICEVGRVVEDLAGLFGDQPPDKRGLALVGGGSDSYWQFNPNLVRIQVEPTTAVSPR